MAIHSQDIDLNKIPEFVRKQRKMTDSVDAVYSSDMTDQMKTEAIAVILASTF